MKLLRKELTLAASPLSFFFLAAAALTFVPGYPILLGAFFMTLGIFYSFRTMRENGDIRYSLLLPVAKRDIVKSKYIFCVSIELAGFVLMTVFTLVRMRFLADTAVYTANALMGANFTFLGFVLLVFGLFNAVFVGGFFKTAYYFGKPFILYIVVSMLVIAAAETLPHLPGCASFGVLGFTPFLPQGCAFAAGTAAYVLLTLLSERASEKRFELIDLE